jgi:hypothetical protein
MSVTPVFEHITREDIMRIRTTILTIVLSLLFASVLLAAQRGIKVTAKTPTGKAIPLYSGSYALIIGNGDYTKGWDPLPGAIRDVNDVTRALKENGFKVILKKNLTRSGFNRALGDFFYKYGRNKTNRLLFYYAGHGHTQQMFTDEALGYLVMVDAPVPEKDPVGFRQSSVDMQAIVTEAKMTKARHVLFMFDSCFSGSILNLRERVVPENISDNVSLPVRQFITAGRANEPVPDHSIFKQAFLDLLEGRDKEPIPDGYITGEELGLYLKNKVPKYNPTQHPQYGKIKDVRLDKGDFVFQLPLSGVKEPPPSIPKAEKGTLDKEMLFWQSIQDSKDPALFEAYLKAFPNGLFTPIARKKIHALQQKKVIASIPPEVSKSKIFVEVDPKDSRVRILNIGPKFYQGMELKPGRYHVETSKQGYETKKMWVSLGAGENKNLDISLEQLQASIQPTATNNRFSQEQARLERERREFEQMKLEFERKKQKPQSQKFVVASGPRKESQNQKVEVASVSKKTSSSRPSSNTVVIKNDSQYIAYAHDVVKDTKTGLEWVAGPDEYTTLSEAKSWVQSLSIDGGGWRMPTEAELNALYKTGAGYRNMTPLLKTTGWVVWAAESMDSSVRWWGFDFRYGDRQWRDPPYDYSIRAFAVRSRGDG